MVKLNRKHVIVSIVLVLLGGCFVFMFIPRRRPPRPLFHNIYTTPEMSLGPLWIENIPICDDKGHMIFCDDVINQLVVVLDANILPGDRGCILQEATPDVYVCTLPRAPGSPTLRIRAAANTMMIISPSGFEATHSLAEGQARQIIMEYWEFRQKVSDWEYKREWGSEGDILQSMSENFTFDASLRAFAAKYRTYSRPATQP